MQNISVLILTKNEQQDLPKCLESVAWSDDIHVFDSVSSDDTVEIARKFGAKVTSRVFDDWASHQNWGLANIRFKHPWVFYIDADERMTAELIEAVRNAVSSAKNCVAFRVRRRDFFMGKWLKHVQASPYYLRLFRPERIKYERLVNPISIVSGEIGQVSGYLDHFPFSKGLGHWIERHNSYSTFEAREIVSARKNGFQISLRKALFGTDFHEQRFHQKQIFYVLPFRPIIKFFILYVAKRGFLDGVPGFKYAVLQSIYEYFIVLKSREMVRASREIAQS
jgi:glycosyltransferase involved in cell wall biosynthesis